MTVETDDDACQPGDQDGELSPEEYDDLLRGCGESWDSPVPGEIIRTATGVWFVRGGSSCVGCNGFCLWHCGMDAVYAAGSTIIAGKEVPDEVLSDACDILETQMAREERPKCKIHLQWLVDLGRWALKARPSEEVQYYGDC